ncbi:hypothetical protein FACS189468_9140 [Spirochaetia bacterium]|nr:hypothetical protein FACS189468_9140 [Spirochaetia bacterium]
MKGKAKKKRESVPMPRFFRILFSILSSLIALALFLAAVAFGVLFFCNSPPKTVPRGSEYDGSIRMEGDGSALVEVREGESAYSVGRRLEGAGLIRTRYFWNLLSRMDDQYVKAGLYRIKIPATQMDIRSVLVGGRQILIRVTIPEGITLKKIARLLAEADICPETSFLAAASDRGILNDYHIPGKTMEGYLYPETYYFPQGFAADRVIRTMADTFFDRIAEIEGAAAALSPEELNKTVIMASIVERECQVQDEAVLMAGVFYKRLDIGMRLESNATVEYVITEIQGKPHPVRQFNRDTEIEDPYNTYVRSGLPPGPICVPGANALDAAFHPAETEYLYFRVVDPDTGRHFFSRTLAEHNRAGERYVPRASSTQ